MVGAAVSLLLVSHLVDVPLGLDSQLVMGHRKAHAGLEVDDGLIVFARFAAGNPRPK